jgi:hypothetical protein
MPIKHQINSYRVRNGLRYSSYCDSNLDETAPIVAALRRAHFHAFAVRFPSEGFSRVFRAARFALSEHRIYASVRVYNSISGIVMPGPNPRRMSVLDLVQIPASPTQRDALRDTLNEHRFKATFSQDLITYAVSLDPYEQCDLCGQGFNDAADCTKHRATCTQTASTEFRPPYGVPQSYL